MTVPLTPLLIASQSRYFTLPIKITDHILSALLQIAFKSEKLHSIFVTQRSQQSAATIITSNGTMLARFEKPPSDITIDENDLPRDRIFHSLQYERILSRSKAFTRRKEYKRTKFESPNEGCCTNTARIPAGRVVVENCKPISSQEGSLRLLNRLSFNNAPHTPSTSPPI